MIGQIRLFLHFSPLEAWNYGKELWVNEGWHNPYFARRIYASRCRKKRDNSKQISCYFTIHFKNSPTIFNSKFIRVQMRTWQTLRQASADFFKQIDVGSIASLGYIINIAHSALCSHSSAALICCAVC